MAALNKNLPIPLYHQLKSALMAAIERGDWLPDQQLPNEGELAQQFAVSKITVRQALRDLAAMGYVRREQGRGTFVSKRKLDHGRELTSFTEEMRRHRLEAASRIISQTVVEADQRVADALEIKPGDPVVVVKRLRLADGEPMGTQSAYIPVNLAAGLVNEKLENVSLYGVLQTRYGLAPARARETYRAVPADAASAELLKVPPGSPVFAVERVTLLDNGRPFEFVESIMRGDRYNVVLDLTANREPQATREGATR